MSIRSSKRFVRKALEKDPDDRYQYAEEMGEALVPWGAVPPSELVESTDTLTMELRQLRAREIELAVDERPPQLPTVKKPQVSGGALLEIGHFLVERFGSEKAKKYIAAVPELQKIVSAGIDRDAWYPTPRPIHLIERVDRIEGRGDRALVAEAGRYLARRAAAESDAALDGRALTPELLFSHVPEVWTHYLQLGEVTVAKVGRGYGRLEIEKFPHASLALCAAIAGYLDEALRIAGARDVDVRVARAAALGDPKDVFEATWSS